MMEKHLLLSIDDDRLRRVTTYASVFVAMTLIIGKLIAYLLTDSVAMLSSLVDSTVDLLASLVTVYGVANALRPPDHDHRYGHGKAEPLAALAQAAFIIGSSVLLCYESISRFYHPHELKHTVFGYVVMVVAMVLTMALLMLQRYVIKRTNSMAIGADHLHYAGDLWINGAVLVALVMQQTTGIVWLDPVFAIAISGALIFSALHIGREALDVLMDKELPESDRAKIIAIAKANPAVQGVHDLRTRSDSDRIFIDFHIEMDPNMTLQAAHDVDEQIMAAIAKEFPTADVIVHQDPAGIEENRLDSRIDQPVAGAR